MKQILVISGTQRANSQTLKMCQWVQSLLIPMNIRSSLLDLNSSWIHELTSNTSYTNPPEALLNIAMEHLQNPTHCIVVCPEYNGSYPGIFKLIIDVLPPQLWMHKRIALIGVSDGRAGNLRGMDHLSEVFQHLKAHVYFNKLPVSNIRTALQVDHPIHALTQEALSKLLEGFSQF